MARALPRLTTRAFTDLALWMGLAGALAGIAFVALAPLLGVPGTVTDQPAFVGACLATGLVLAGTNLGLARMVVGSRVAALAGGMTSVRADLFRAGAAGDATAVSPSDAPDEVPVDSADELGTAAGAFNDLRDAVVHSHRLEHAVAAVSATMARHVGPEPLAAAALKTVMAWTGATGGLVVGLPDASPPAVLAADGVPDRTVVQVLTLARTLGPDRGARCAFPPHLGLTVTPLDVGAGRVGLLVLDMPGAPGAYDRLLAVLGETLAAALSNAQLHERVRRLASVDEPTGLLNRRAGLERLARLLAQPRRTDPFVGVLLLDVDRFKRVNDVHGHLVGDGVLRDAAAVVAAALRPGDVLCRYGGDELLAVLPGAGQHTVGLIGERVRAAVADAALTVQSGTVRLTVSVGGATVCPPGTSVETLLAAADAALIAARTRGGDAVRTGPGPSLPEALPAARRARSAAAVSSASAVPASS